MKQVHTIAPVFDSNSSVLVLGSFPSVKSREGQFFYHHPQNRFWRVMERLYQTRPLETVEQKRQFLLSHRIALWDVIASCDIKGSSDSSIQNVVVNNINDILNVADIRQIFCNGKKAFTLYEKFLLEQTHRAAVCLPSTSPANASWGLDRLCECWRIIME